MWTIREAQSLQRTMRKLPGQIREKYEVWKDIVRHSGVQGLGQVRGFRDEALKGKWAGFRSSRLSQAYRVIYRTEEATFLVLVERVSKHDYRS